MNLREMPVWEKPREKLLREGKEALSNVEILTILLRTGTREKSAMKLATEILSADRTGLRFLTDCTPEELREINGMGNAKICELLAAVELGKRIACLPSQRRVAIRCSGDIADIFMEKLRYEKKEHFKCLMINAKGEILEEKEISVGDLNSSASHPREAFVAAVRRSAGSVAFVHNHPSGDPQPSEADIGTTRRLAEAGKLLGIPVLDHIIIGDGVYVSMKAAGFME